jgi:nitrogen fixation protein NifU and related proteins
MYSKKVLELFKCPHNMGKISNPDGVGKVGNIICGDVMYLYIKIKGDRIADIKFETFGCASAIATSSMITDLAKGKTIEEALRITKQNVADALDGLPPIKMHCSNLAAEALHEAIYDYLTKKKLPVPASLKKEHDMAGKHLDDISHMH